MLYCMLFSFGSQYIDTFRNKEHTTAEYGIMSEHLMCVCVVRPQADVLFSGSSEVSGRA